MIHHAASPWGFIVLCGIALADATSNRRKIARERSRAWRVSLATSIGLDYFRFPGSHQLYSGSTTRAWLVLLNASKSGSGGSCLTTRRQPWRVRFHRLHPRLSAPPVVLFYAAFTPCSITRAWLQIFVRLFAQALPPNNEVQSRRRIATSSKLRRTSLCGARTSSWKPM